MTGQPISTLQGVVAQNVQLNPQAFYPATRRMQYPMKPAGPIAGLGVADSVTLKQTGIIAALDIRISGNVVFGGTIAGTSLGYRWPYGLIKAVKVSANGQANLVNASGLHLKALQMVQTHVNDRGISRKIGANTIQSGTLSLSSDDWGSLAGVTTLGPGVTVASAGTYTVDLTIRVPIAFDQRTLLGAIFAQTAQTNLTCDIEYETQANLLTLGGAATVTFAGLNSEISGVVYTIPQVGGSFVVPDLSAFHQVIATRYTSLAQGDNEVPLSGTGIGRQLMRVLYQVYSGAGVAAVPYAMTAANFGQQAWRYGGNDTPESYRTGSGMRAFNEDQTGVDLGGQWGFGLHDFASEWALRDSVDEGSTSDLRILTNLVNAPTTPSCEYLQQTIFAAPVGA